MNQTYRFNYINRHCRVTALAFVAMLAAKSSLGMSAGGDGPSNAPVSTPVVEAPAKVVTAEMGVQTDPAEQAEGVKQEPPKVSKEIEIQTDFSAIQRKSAFENDYEAEAFVKDFVRLCQILVDIGIHFKTQRGYHWQLDIKVLFEANFSWIDSLSSIKIKEFLALKPSDYQFLMDIAKGQKDSALTNLLKRAIQSAIQESIHLHGIVDESVAIYPFFQLIETLFTKEMCNQMRAGFFCMAHTNEPKQLITGAAVIQWMQQFPGLKKLCFHDCPNVLTDELMNEVNQTDKYPNICDFRFMRGSGKLLKNKDCMARFVQTHPRLDSFGLTDCHLVVDAKFVSALVKHCVNLEYLALDSTSDNLTEEDFLKLANLKRLHGLEVKNATHFTLNSLKSILEGGFCPDCWGRCWINIEDSAADKAENKEAIEQAVNQWFEKFDKGYSKLSISITGKNVKVERKKGMD